MTKLLTLALCLCSTLLGISFEREIGIGSLIYDQRRPFGHYRFEDDASNEAGIDLVSDGDCVKLRRNSATDFELRRC